MELEVLKKSKKPPMAGDIFVCKPQGHDYYFGRVIFLDGKLGGFNCMILYIYNASSKNPKEIPALDKGSLLLPPVGTNAKGWSLGYFETVESRPLEKTDILDGHSFYSKVRNSYFDEKGNLLPGPIEPVGGFGLDGIEGIGRQIGKKLGITA